MRCLRLYVCVFALSVLFSTKVFSQYDVRAQYTLNECLRIAQEQNLDIQNSILNVQNQSTAVTQAFGSYLPSVNAGMGYSRLLNPDGGRAINIGGIQLPIAGTPPNSYNMNATASYSIFNGFAREANYSRSQAQLTSVEFSNKRTRETVAFNVYSRFYNVMRAMQSVYVRKENIEVGKKELERISALHEAGRIAIAALYSQEADLGTRELELLQAENQLQQNKAQLLATIGLPANAKTEFLEPSLEKIIDAKSMSAFRNQIGSFEKALSLALKTRADVLSQTEQIRSAELSVESARANYLPDLSANGGWSWSGTEFNNFDANGRFYVGMNLSVPIFDNFNASSQTQQARIAVQQREIESKQLEQQIRTELQSAFISLESAEKQIEITVRSAKAAEKNREASKERLDVGAGSMQEYLLANQQFVSAKINQINAVYSYYEAQANIQFVLGTLSYR